jgi:hypothetical protein
MGKRNTTIKTKDRAKRTSSKSWGGHIRSVKASSSCSTSIINRVTRDRNHVISHERGNENATVISTNVTYL